MAWFFRNYVSDLTLRLVNARVKEKFMYIKVDVNVQNCTYF